MAATLETGDHVLTEKLLYTHHGIYVGGNQVVHYAGNKVMDLATARVRVTSLQQFLDGGTLKKRIYPSNADSPAVVLQRVHERLNEARYNIVFNNCEHFATHCKTGTGQSGQVRVAVSIGSVAVGAILLASFLEKTRTRPSDVRSSTPAPAAVSRPRPIAAKPAHAPAAKSAPRPKSGSAKKSKPASSRPKARRPR